MMYDFHAVGLEFEEQKYLQEIPIEICTFYGPGPRPKSTTAHDCTPDVPFGKFIVPDNEAFSQGFYWQIFYLPVAFWKQYLSV